MADKKPAQRIKSALSRAADLATEKSVIVEVCAGNITYRVIPKPSDQPEETGKPVDAPEDIRL